jgi:hypothetical protein
VTLVLDAGAFLAWERGDREVAALILASRTEGDVPVTHGGVVGQVWRGGAGKQAGLGQLLLGCRVVALDEALGRRVGALLATARKRDVVDAAVVLLARDDDVILTSDPDDLRPLAVAADLHVDIVRV